MWPSVGSMSGGTGEGTLAVGSYRWEQTERSWEDLEEDADGQLRDGAAAAHYKRQVRRPSFACLLVSPCLDVLLQQPSCFLPAQQWRAGRFSCPALYCSR